MKSNSLSTRKNIRLKNYNYSQVGYYFVTICTNFKECTLCKIEPNSVGDCFSGPNIIISDLGMMVDKYINNIDTAYSNVSLDCYILMPNHIHLIIAITSNQNNINSASTSLSQIIKSLKIITTKKARFQIWQKNYYEHIIRKEHELDAIREYIINNPFKWCDDDYYINH